jgi:hypothetical protein
VRPSRASVSARPGVAATTARAAATRERSSRDTGYLQPGRFAPVRKDLDTSGGKRSSPPRARRLSPESEAKLPENRA